MSNFTYHIAQSDKSSHFSTQIDLDAEELSQEALDGRIASLDAELAALRAEMALENEEEAQAGDFEDFADNSYQSPVLSQENSIGQTQTQFLSLDRSIQPNFEKIPSQVNTSAVYSIYSPQTVLLPRQSASIDQYFESTGLQHHPDVAIISTGQILEPRSQILHTLPSESSSAPVDISQFIDSSHEDIAGPHCSLSTLDSDRSTHRITSTFNSVDSNLAFIAPDNTISSNIVSSVSDTVPDSPIASISTLVTSTSTSSLIELPDTQSSSQVVPDTSYHISSSQSNLSHRTASIEPFTGSTNKSNHQEAPVSSIDPALQPTSQVTDISNVATSRDCRG